MKNKMVENRIRIARRGLIYLATGLSLSFVTSCQDDPIEPNPPAPVAPVEMADFKIEIICEDGFTYVTEKSSDFSPTVHQANTLSSNTYYVKEWTGQKPNVIEASVGTQNEATIRTYRDGVLTKDTTGAPDVSLVYISQP